MACTVTGFMCIRQQEIDVAIRGSPEMPALWRTGITKEEKMP
jgi:hypothetical protein